MVIAVHPFLVLSVLLNLTGADASTLELKRKTELKALLNQVDDQTTELAEYEKTITQNESALTNVRRNEEILQETLRQNETSAFDFC